MRLPRGSSFVFAAALVTSAATTRAGHEDGDLSPAVYSARLGKVVATAAPDVERMCALLVSCDAVAIPPSLFPREFASCVSKMTAELASPAAIAMSLTLRECARAASSCADLRACALRGASDDACAGRGKQGLAGVCDMDGRALTCWHDRVFSVHDCPRGGESCRVVGGQATCTLGSCAAESPDAGAPHCSASGTHLLRCENGRLTSVDCAALGLVCSPLADGAAACATAGPPCGDASAHCEGGVAVGCFNGHPVRVDCAAAGLACGAGPGDTVLGACSLGAPATPACDPNARARCEGASIQYCAFGRPRSFSCKAAGFAGCDAVRPGAPGEVRCVP